jgi:Mg-chelatase subunit ChlD
MRKNTLAVIGILVVAAAAYVGMRSIRKTPLAQTTTAQTGATSAPGSATTAPPSTGQTGAPTPIDASTPAAASADVAAASASMPKPPKPLRWFSIADATLGGHVEQITSVSPDRNVAAEHLIEGGFGNIECTPFCFWAAKDATVPQDIVLSFYQRREAKVARVVLDTLTPETRSRTDGLPRQVEIAVSTTSATDGFSEVARADLPSEWNERAIDFAPVGARFLRIRIASTHGNARAILGEVKVYEAEEAPSILADLPANLALPALGGAIVSYTNDYAWYTAARLIDGDPRQEWRSGEYYLPQEFVFAMHDDALALIDRVVLTTREQLTTAPKVVTVSTSRESPVDGFEEVGRFTLKQAAADQALPVKRLARFVKLRVIDDFGGKIYTSLGEVQLLEGAAPGYESVLFRREDVRQTTARGEGPPVDDPGTPVEQEKNDQIGQANRLDLGGAVRGGINPIGENDFFKIAVPGPQRSVLTFDLAERPNIRTSISLVNGSGGTVKRFDPAHVPAEQARFSWLVDAGDYALQVTQPPSSVVVIWDTSGSMERNVADLQKAVETFIDQVSPTEVVNLIRFSYDIEVLLPDFTSDRARLKKATAGKFFADGHTPFYDAVAKAMSMLDARAGNRAIVVMTDGEDAGSKVERGEFWQQLQDKGIRLYTIAMGDAGRYSLRLGSSPRRLLRHFSTATNGQSFFAENSADLVRFYKQIADELQALCTYRLKVTRAQATGALEVKATGERMTSVAAPAQLELILDASGSMKRSIGGRMMIDTAKNVLSDIVRGLPDDMHVALRVYGHRIREGRPGACEDSQLVFPFAKLDKPQLLASIRSVQALGTTPIAYSLQQVAKDMGTAGEKMIVLVTDGKEECGGDPAAAVKQLASGGVKLKLNIVGFALADASLKAELQKLAQLTAGQFVDARDATSLRSAIEQSFALPYEVFDAAGTKVGEGTAGQAAVQLPEGTYRVRVKAEQPIDVANVRITAQQATTIELKKEGREVAVQVR